MKIIHRVSFNVGKVAKYKLDSAGIHVNEGFVAFEIDEQDERWPDVFNVIKEFNVNTLVRTEFTKKEMNDADILAMSSTWYWSYPMPDNDFGYLEMTYDLSNYCSRCGIGAVQKSPFRLKKEPKWGKNDILRLNWVYDEFFVKPDVWEKVFQPFGIGNLSVLNYKTGKELTTIVQLKINRDATCNLDVSALNKDYCNQCNRTKYRGISRGKFPHFLKSQDNSLVIFKTKEYFGSGGIGCKGVIVTNVLYQAITSANLKGVTFAPVAESK